MFVSSCATQAVGIQTRVLTRAEQVLYHPLSYLPKSIGGKFWSIGYDPAYPPSGAPEMVVLEILSQGSHGRLQPAPGAGTATVCPKW